MRKTTIFILASIISITASGQLQTFEIFGTIKGQYNSKVYLFFDGNYRQKDSIVADIKNGKFYFKASAHLPIQVRFHLDQVSYIQDVFVDSKKTFITSSNKIEISGKNNDTSNIFTITEVSGSRTETLKRNFENWLTALNSSAKPDQEKQQEYYNMLYEFVSKYPGNKTSPYLIAKATTLRYSQVNSLNSLLDSSLQNTFEAKSALQLLKRLDNSKRSSAGVSFRDFLLKDTSGFEVNTKQLRGKYTFIVFWASGCVPCRVEHPKLNKLYEQYKDKGLEMVGISIDEDRGRWAKAVAKDKLHWPQLSDLKHFSGIGDYYGLIETTEGIPFNILLDKDGKIIDKKISLDHLETILQTL